MMAYLHHIMFDPLSWWEQTKLDLAWTAFVLGFVAPVYIAMVRKGRK